jgi:hypothetical protein
MHNSLRKLTEYIAFADLALLCCSVILGFIAVKKLPKNLRFFLFYLTAVLIIEVVAKIHIYILKSSNIYLLHIYTFFEFLWLSLFYKETIKLAPKEKKWITWLMFTVLVMLAVYAVDSLAVHTVKLMPLNFYLYSKSITNILLLLFSVILLIQFVRGYGRKALADTIIFRLNAGVLIYFSTSFIIFMAINKLINIPLEQSIILWLINALVTFIFYTLVFTSFLNIYWKKLQHG